MQQTTSDLDVSNAIRLSGREWVGLALFMVALYLLVPVAWRRVEKVERTPDYRVPFSLSGDYWHWSGVAARAAATHDTVLLGDSVVWGMYVRPGETLSHYLNSLEGRDRFANLGVNGMQPVALAGLVEHHGSALRNVRVLLQCNPLWMSSPKRDLREKEEYDFNHSELGPQFSPWIPCYKKSVSDRLDRVFDRNVAFRGWTRHLQHAYFSENGTPRTIPDWMLEHPYENPLRAVTLRVPPPGDELQQEPIPWIGRIPQEDMPWVDLAGSIQWASFQRLVEVLQQRGNSVAVLVGPFNEHLLKEPSRVKYRELRSGIEAWLRERKIPYASPEALPSEHYGDASHPLSAGYALLAERLRSSGILN